MSVFDHFVGMVLKGLIQFMSQIFFINPKNNRKPQVFSSFQGVHNNTSGIEWVKAFYVWTDQKKKRSQKLLNDKCRSVNVLYKWQEP